MTVRRLLLALPLAVVVVPSYAQAPDRPVRDRVTIEVLSSSNSTQENLRVLTDEIGGRVPGTPQFDRAERWAVDAFRRAGADEVHTEPFSIPQSWSEGATSVEVVAPVQFRVHANSIAWTPALTGTTAPLVDVGMGSSAEFARAGNIDGAVVLVHSTVLKTWDDLFAEYLRAPDVLARAVAGKALAVAFTSTREHDILYRHINTQSGRIDVTPQLLLAREDAERLGRIAAEGKKVQVHLSAPNRIGPSISSHNVVAELRGSDLANEIVVLGAHLDSWELGTGALDDGCNAALVVDTLRALKAAGVHPRRTIRFVLFSGEEQGLFGSMAYVRTHRDEMDNVAAEVILDEGSGGITGFSTGGRKDVGEALAPVVKQFAKVTAEGITNDAFVGTDNYDFLLEGVPTLVANQLEANYLVNYHATSDTFDKVDIDRLKQNEALTANLIAELAGAPQRIGRRLTRAEIEATMKETHLDDQMKTLGLWEDWAKGRRGRKP